MNNINKKQATTAAFAIEWILKQHRWGQGENGLNLKYQDLRELADFFNSIAVDKRAFKNGDRCYRGKKLTEDGFRILETDKV